MKLRHHLGLWFFLVPACLFMGVGLWLMEIPVEVLARRLRQRAEPIPSPPPTVERPMMVH